MPSPSEAAKPCRATSVVLLAALSCGCGLLDKLRDADDEAREPPSPSKTPPDAEEPEADNAAATGDLPADGDTATAKPEMVDHQVGKRDGPLKPGPVYFSVRGSTQDGIARLQDGKFDWVLDCTVDGGTELVRGHDSHTYVQSPNGIYMLDGPNGPQRITRGTDPWAIDVAPDGSIWAVGLDTELAHYYGSWKTINAAELGLDPETRLRDVVVDQGGRVWIVSDDHIHVYEDGRLASAEPTTSLGYSPKFDGIALARDGAILASGMLELFRLRSLVDYESHGFEPREDGPVRQHIHELNDASVVVELHAGLARIAPDGSVTHYHAGIDFEGGLLLGSSADRQDRLWVATGAGISMIGPGKERTFWPTGSIPGIVGLVRQILVVADGPDSLPAPGPVATGGMKGVVTYKGALMGSVPVAICPDCELDLDGEFAPDSSRLLNGTTDEEGHFVFQEVPLNRYNLYVEIDGKWKHAFRLPRWFLREGEVLDFGAVDLD